MIMLLVFHDQRYIFCCICLLFAMFKSVLPDLKIFPLLLPSLMRTAMRVSFSPQHFLFLMSVCYDRAIVFTFSIMEPYYLNRKSEKLCCYQRSCSGLAHL